MRSGLAKDTKVTYAGQKTNGNLNNWIKSNFIGTSPTGSALSLFAISSTVVYVGSVDGNIFKSTDGGANFSLMASLPIASSPGYLDLHFLDANNGYACCSNRIYKTIDGGISWTPVVSLGTGLFIEIHFTDANHGWGSTSAGAILKLN